MREDLCYYCVNNFKTNRRPSSTHHTSDVYRMLGTWQFLNVDEQRGTKHNSNMTEDNGTQTWILMQVILDPFMGNCRPTQVNTLQLIHVLADKDKKGPGASCSWCEVSQLPAAWRPTFPSTPHWRRALLSQASLSSGPQGGGGMRPAGFHGGGCVVAG